MRPVIIGIDPGLTGAYAVLSNGGTELIEYGALQIVDGAISSSQFGELLFKHQAEGTPPFFCIEEITPRPGQSVVGVKTSAVNFGRILGSLDAYGASYTTVRPSVWAAAMLGKTAGKETAVLEAGKLFPVIRDLGKIKASAISDAIFIARYAYQKGL